MITFHDIEYFRSHYNEYLKTRWWKDLNNQLIDSNPGAKCWICQKKYSLLLHHLGDEAYAHLFSEKLNVDVFILCWDCHERVHFHKHSGKKVPLTKKDLWFRMKLLKYTYSVRSFRLGSWLQSILVRSTS